MEEIKIKTEYIKLDALLKYSNLVYSGGEAKTVIAENMVEVNGEVCSQRGKKLYDGDIVTFAGNEIKVIYED